MEAKWSSTEAKSISQLPTWGNLVPKATKLDQKRYQNVFKSYNVLGNVFPRFQRPNKERKMTKRIYIYIYMYAPTRTRLKSVPVRVFYGVIYDAVCDGDDEDVRIP